MASPTANGGTGGTGGTGSTGGAPKPPRSSPGTAGGAAPGVPKPSVVSRAATTTVTGTSLPATGASPPGGGPASGGGSGPTKRRHHHHQHRRVYSAVEGSMAQQALLEGTASMLNGIDGLGAELAAWGPPPGTGGRGRSPLGGGGGMKVSPLGGKLSRGSSEGGSPIDRTTPRSSSSPTASSSSPPSAADVELLTKSPTQVSESEALRGTLMWNELAQAKGAGLVQDQEEARRQEEEAREFIGAMGDNADAEEDEEMVPGTPTRACGAGGSRTPTAGSASADAAGVADVMGGTSSGAVGGAPDDFGAAAAAQAAARYEDFDTPRTAVSGTGGGHGGGAGGAGGSFVWEPPSLTDADGLLLTSPDLRPPLSQPNLGASASITSSTRSIPGSLVGPHCQRGSGIGGASGGGGAGGAGGASQLGSRAYTDIIEDEKADHRDTENLEGLSIGGDDDDENNSIISGVTTWVPLTGGGGGGSGGGGAGGDDDDKSARSGTRRGGKTASRKTELEDVDETTRSLTGVSGGSSGHFHRRSSGASSKDGGESGYVTGSSASGGAVSNDVFLQQMRGGGGGGSDGGGGGGGGGAAHHRITASAATDRATGSGRKSQRHAATAAGRAKLIAGAAAAQQQQQQQLREQMQAPHSPVGRDTQSPTSLEDLPRTPTRTGGSIQGSLSTLGTTGAAAAGVAPPFPTAPAAAAAAAGSASGGGGGGEGTNELLLSAITDLRGHVDRTLEGVRDQNRGDFERVLAIMQNESSKRSALESRLHAQLLLQSEAMVAMEMKLLRLEAKVEGKGKGQGQHHQHRGSGGNTGPPVSVLRESGLTSAGATPSGPIVSSLPPISSERPYEEEDLGSLEDGGVPRAVRASRAFPASGASLASAVTDGFTIEDDNSTKSGRDASTAPLGGDEVGEGGDVSVDGSASTPTFSSRHRTLDSILMDPEIRGEVSVHGTSTRATRGSDDNDGDSTLATSMTSTTRGSTVFTGASTRGESVNVQVRALSGLSEGANEYENGGSGAEDSGMADENPAAYGGISPTGNTPNEERSQRSRSQSPLTVQSRETASVGPQSIASHSIAASQISTAVVAPHRSRAYRIRHDRAPGGASSRPLANRLVQFTSTPAELADGADEVTVPDELDNLSSGDVAETFARSANQWREEYEARLDAIQKRYGHEGD